MAIRGSILLVDDEEKILKALGRALRTAGHEVIETTSPRDAQRLLAELPEPHLVPRQVSKAVGNVKNNGPELIEPVEPVVETQTLF